MPGTELDDAALGTRVRSGDNDAFGVLYERYMPHLYDFAARLVRDPAAAEDLVQATFIRAYEHRTSLRDPSKVKSWLFTTAHNLAFNHLERRRPAELVEEQWDLAAPGRGPEGEAVARDAAELVWDAAASLEPRQYAVLDLSIRQELTTPEIADVLGLPAGHAAVLVNRAREALGNAVRYLMVARRRDHCERLAQLIPAGVRSLTPEQRSTVDHHMRHCEDCEVMARRLTAPAELFGGLAVLPVPIRLRTWRGWRGSSQAVGANHLHASPRHRPRWLSRAMQRPVVSLAVGVAVGLVATAGVLAAHHGAAPTQHAPAAASSTLLPIGDPCLSGQWTLQVATNKGGYTFNGTRLDLVGGAGTKTSVTADGVASVDWTSSQPLVGTYYGQSIEVVERGTATLKLHGDGHTQTGEVVTSSFTAYFIYRGQTYPLDAKLSFSSGPYTCTATTWAGPDGTATR